MARGCGGKRSVPEQGERHSGKVRLQTNKMSSQSRDVEQWLTLPLGGISSSLEEIYKEGTYRPLIIARRNFGAILTIRGGQHSIWLHIHTVLRFYNSKSFIYRVFETVSYILYTS